MPLGHFEPEFRKLTYHVQEGLLVYLLRELEKKHFLPEAAKLIVSFGRDARPMRLFLLPGCRGNLDQRGEFRAVLRDGRR